MGQKRSVVFTDGGTSTGLGLLLFKKAFNKGIFKENLLPCRGAGGRVRWTGDESVCVRLVFVPLNMAGVMEVHIL